MAVYDVLGFKFGTPVAEGVATAKWLNAGALVATTKGAAWTLPKATYAFGVGLGVGALSGVVLASLAIVAVSYAVDRESD